MEQWVKDLALLQLWLRFHPWPGNFHMPQVKPREKKKKKLEKKKVFKSNIQYFCFSRSRD